MPDTRNSADPPKPGRRWFQFRLRTLLAVVVVLSLSCAYAGQQYKTVRDRQGWLKTHIRPWGLPCDRYLGGRPPKYWADGEPDIKPSSIRRWLGDESHETIELHKDATTADIEQANELFPESEIIQYFGEPSVDDSDELKFDPVPATTDPRSPFEIAHPSALPPKLP
jgi:hypothetical protein